jgi:hypothetical protein
LRIWRALSTPRPGRINIERPDVFADFGRQRSEPALEPLGLANIATGISGGSLAVLAAK